MFVETAQSHCTMCEWYQNPYRCEHRGEEYVKTPCELSQKTGESCEVLICKEERSDYCCSEKCCLANFTIDLNITTGMFLSDISVHAIGPSLPGVKHCWCLPQLQRDEHHGKDPYMDNEEARPRLNYTAEKYQYHLNSLATQHLRFSELRHGPKGRPLPPLPNQTSNPSQQPAQMYQQSSAARMQSSQTGHHNT